MWVKLSLDLKRPVIIHCRKAYEDLFEFMKAEGVSKYGFLLHSYGGSSEQISKFTELGAYFSVSGNITSYQNKKVRKNVLEFPLDRLLIETDAPSMNPWIDGKKSVGINCPQNLIYVFKELCLILQMSENELSLILENNFKKFVGDFIRE